MAEVLLGLSGGLNAADANRTTTDRLATAGKNGSFTTRNAKAIRLRSVVYAGASDTVTLMPVRPFARGKPVQLLVYGTGPTALQDSGGRPIDGNDDGQPGSNAVAILTRSGTTINVVSLATVAVDGFLSRGELRGLTLPRR